MTPEKLLGLLLECRRRNQALGVTGLLLYGNGTFLQAIEGDDEVIDELVSTILKDSRHENVQVLSRKSITEREYAEWSMGFEQVSGEDLGQVEGLASFEPDDFTFEYLSGNAPVVDSLLQHYREPHWDQIIGELDAKDRVIRHLEEALARVRGRAQITRLALEGITEAIRQGKAGGSVLQLCEATLESLRPAREH
ncbi:BLUF domain-containing protein [Thiorhodococcus minor]|uniref:BLUF domain-containing protein n=2 Tax=Thiorhodococcus minor TaxID=57489 RepID=A0A6M0K5V4_9GAMM|nr:BLUF domain-containing protein [Thiorhodococcus minor]